VEVAFAFKEEHALLRREGFKVFRVPDVTISDFSGNVFAEYTPSFVEQCVEAEREAIETFRPEVIVGDMRLSAAISARVAGVPYVSIVNGYMTDYFDPVDVMIPKEKSRFKHEVASLIGRGIQAVQKRRLASPFRTTARKYDIKTLTSLYDFLEGDLTLIADLPEYCPLGDLPSAYRYIGPLIWEESNGETPEFLKQRDSSRPLVYATAGNTGKAELLALVAAAFKNSPSYDVVMTTGAYIQPDKIPSAPNIHVTRFISGSKVLRNCTASIHCGGSGTSYQAISHGVPSVVVPFNNDQKINAWLIKRRRLGIPLSPPGLTDQKLRATLEEVVYNAEIQAGLQRFQELVLESNGPKAAADAISSCFSLDVLP
jgi:MGT family glycosyltransferase